MSVLKRASEEDLILGQIVYHVVNPATKMVIAKDDELKMQDSVTCRYIGPEGYFMLTVFKWFELMVKKSEDRVEDKS